MTIEEVKKTVARLLGQRLKVKYNRGRNNYATFFGRITEAYPNVFIVECEGQKAQKISCVYADVVCGELVFCESS